MLLRQDTGLNVVSVFNLFQGSGNRYPQFLRNLINQGRNKEKVLALMSWSQDGAPVSAFPRVLKTAGAPNVMVSSFSYLHHVMGGALQT